MSLWSRCGWFARADSVARLIHLSPLFDWPQKHELWAHGHQHRERNREQHRTNDIHYVSKQQQQPASGQKLILNIFHSLASCSKIVHESFLKQWPPYIYRERAHKADGPSSYIAPSSSAWLPVGADMCLCAAGRTNGRKQAATLPTQSDGCS